LELTRPSVAFDDELDLENCDMHKTDSHTPDGKRGEVFAASMLRDILLAGDNLRGYGQEAPWETVAHYVINLERRVCELEDMLKSNGPLTGEPEGESG
jgi:hypothetical protein